MVINRHATFFYESSDQYIIVGQAALSIFGLAASIGLDEIYSSWGFVVYAILQLLTNIGLILVLGIRPSRPSPHWRVLLFIAGPPIETVTI